MMQHSSTLEILFMAFAVLILSLILEYYLLVFVDVGSLVKLHPQLQKGVRLVLEQGKILRVITLLTYSALTWTILRVPSQEKQPSSMKHEWGKILAVSLMFVLSAYGLSTVSIYETQVIYYLYPASSLGILLGIPMILTMMRRLSGSRQEVSEKLKIDNLDSICISTEKGFINVANPYRGTLVIGSSGSGKSASIGNAFLHQFIQKDYCGILYDFKFPTLASEINTALHLYEKDDRIKYFIINLENPKLSHCCNPLSPENIPTVAHAEEYARAIVNNLDTSTIKQRDFFSNSAIAWLASLIWFFRSEHPKYCTLPHVINTILYKDYAHVISMLEANPQSADMVRSIATAIQNKAEKQIAGVIASLQIMVSKINSPEIVWALTGADFDMNINDPDNPKLLCLGSDPGMVDTFSPVISLIITVALKQMNKQGKHKSFVLLDEAPTLYIPKFEMIPATARSNKVASVYMAQDYAQMQDMYGRDKAEVIIANLSNQFYGKVSSVQTAKAVSEMIGREERSITNYSKSSSRGSKGSRNLSYNTSISQQERFIIKPQEVMQLQPGEFIGQSVESTIPYFRAQTKLIKPNTNYQIKDFSRIEGNTKSSTIQYNFQKIRKEVDRIVQQYPNINE